MLGVTHKRVVSTLGAMTTAARDDDEMSLTPATRWPVTRVLCYPTTGEGCDSCEPNNTPFTNRAVLFRTQGVGLESEMAATWPDIRPITLT